jgi:hypothetical protein
LTYDVPLKYRKVPTANPCPVWEMIWQIDDESVLSVESVTLTSDAVPAPSLMTKAKVKVAAMPDTSEVYFVVGVGRVAIANSIPVEV